MSAPLAGCDKIVFDFDGTLLNTGRGIFAALRYTLGKHGRSLPDEELGKFVGPSMFWACREYLGADDDTAREMTQDYRAFLWDSGWQLYDPYPGVEALLRRLKAQGKRLYIATNKPQPLCERILAHAGLAPLFESVAGIGMADRAQTKRELILRALGGDTHGACMVGDRHLDAEGARETGIPCIYALYGYGSSDEADECGAEYRARSAREMAALLGCEGMLISFEGTDGVGKTTQIRLLAEHLAAMGERTTVTREPGGCPVADKIRALLLDRSNADMTPLAEAYLYAAARAQHVATVIRPALERGETVLCDRFADSSAAYQGAGRALGMDEVMRLNAPAMEGAIPTRTYLLDADTAIGLGRIESPDRLEAEGDSFMRRVREGFLALAEAAPERIVRLRADRPAEEVAADIANDISALLLG